MTIKFAKTKKDAIIPSKKAEDAGYDIYPCFEENYIRIGANHTKLVPTGIASALPENYYFQIEERGSTGSKGIKKSAGVIDSGYRGEWFIAITNCNNKDLLIVKEGTTIKNVDEHIIYPYEKAIAQAVLHEVPPATVEEVTYDELKSIASDRGDGAFGSSGK